LAVEALSQVFRGKFTEGLRDLYMRGKLQFHGSLMKIAGAISFNRFIQPLRNKDWIVYAKPPFGGPEQVLKYLARYTHRVAISISRLIDFRDGNVSFLWRDYIPGGLVRIRHFGLFANRKRGSTLAHCRSLLDAPPADPLPPPPLRCPSCSSIMMIVERLSRAQLYFRFPLQPLSIGRHGAKTT
jgi:hypothetical protein